MKNDNKLDKGRQAMHVYAKYSSITFQVILLVLIGGWGGQKLDKLLALSFPLFTIIFVILAAILGFYHLVRSLLKK